MFSLLKKQLRVRCSNCWYRNYSRELNGFKRFICGNTTIPAKSRVWGNTVNFQANHNGIHLIQKYSYSIAAKKERRLITNTSQLLLLMQSGKYDELVSEIKKKYKNGFYLSDTDLTSFIHRFTEFKRYDLTNELYCILEESESTFIIENAPLFCYNFLLSGDIHKAFSLLTQSSDEYLVLKREFSSLSQEALPQEYLYVRLCIQMMSDCLGLSNKISPFPQYTPNHSKTPSFASQSYSLIDCFLFSWIYLTTAISMKTQQVTSTISSDIPIPLKELFASPYTPLSSNTHTLTPSSFSSFTYRSAEQRLHSTLRSLELLLWYFYSRSVYEVDFIKNTMKSTSSFSQIIENAYQVMKNRPDFWTRGIFQFFIFYYSQPDSNSSSSTKQKTMRDSEKVSYLINQVSTQKKTLSSSFIQMIIRKEDLKLSDFSTLLSFLLNRNMSPTQIQSFLQNEENFLIAFGSELAKRNAKEEFKYFIEELFYLNIPLSEHVWNQLLLDCCCLQQIQTKERMIKKIRSTSHIQSDILCSCIIEGVCDNEDISEYLSLMEFNEQSSVYLLHSLLMIHDMKLLNTEGGKQLTEYCNSKRIHFSSDNIQLLLGYYQSKQDYQNICSLFQYIRSNHLTVQPSVFQLINEMVDEIQKSKSRLFGSTSILDIRPMNSKRWLPRANSKYNLDKAYTPLHKALSLFKDDEKSISINTILETTIHSYCEESVYHYGTWIYLVYFNKQSHKLESPINLNSTTITQASVMVTKTTTKMRIIKTILN